MERDYSSMPAWFTKWETTGLLTFEDKNGDSILQRQLQGRSILAKRPKAAIDH
jgi:hypothetical protein